MSRSFSSTLRLLPRPLPVLPVYLVLLMIATSVVATNFDDCKDKFNNLADKTPYLYTGLLYNGATIPPDQADNFISLPGCLKLCGSGVDYYHWKDVSRTITTWVLPVVGLLLQLPFESNQLRARAVDRISDCFVVVHTLEYQGHRKSRTVIRHGNGFQYNTWRG